MEKKESVVIFSTAYLPYLGGAELAIKEITDRIPNVDFFLITARLDKKLLRRERIGNVEVYRIGLGIGWLDKLLLLFLGAVHTRRLLKKYQVLCFWGVMVSYATITPVLLKMAGFYRKVPFLLTLQEGDSEQHIAKDRFGLISFWWGVALRYADHVQAISNYLAKLAKDFGYKGSITIIPNGVNANVFYPRNILKKKNVIVTTSRLVRKNGIDLLVLAMQAILKKIPNAELHIIGDGSDRNILESMARKIETGYGYTPGTRIIFSGKVSFEKVPDYLAEAYIFVRPSRSEGLGTAFLEAMAMGIPVVATRVGGIPDFLEDGVTGLFAREEDAEDVARQVIRLLENEALYNQLSQNGQNLVKEKYAWDVIALQMKEMLNIV